MFRDGAEPKKSFKTGGMAEDGSMASEACPAEKRRGSGDRRGGVRMEVGDMHGEREPWGDRYIPPPYRGPVQRAKKTNRGSVELDTPDMSVEGKGVHFNPDFDPGLDERLVCLKYLFLYAEMEARKIVTGRVRRQLEQQAPSRDILDIVPAKTEKSEIESEEESEEGVKSASKIESFADFENEMFASKSKNGAKMYTCPHKGCGMELPTLSRIKRHYIVHTKLRPFRCMNKECGKRFSRKDNMLQHYKVHCSHNSYR